MKPLKNISMAVVLAQLSTVALAKQIATKVPVKIEEAETPVEKQADKKAKKHAAKAAAEKTAKKSGAKMNKEGVEIEVLAEGNGAVATKGQKVKVHYTGWLLDKTAADGKGKKFDSSVDRGQPFSFGLGSGMVIRGWDIGVEGMKIGEKRKLTIPADKAYGDREMGGGLIPAGSTLVFEVELLGVGA